MKRRGKAIAISSVTAGLLTIGAMGFVCRERLLEEWYSWTFRFAGVESRWKIARRLEELGARGRTLAESWYLERIEKGAPYEQDAAEERLGELLSVAVLPELVHFHSYYSLKRLQRICKARPDEATAILVRVMCDERVNEAHAITWPFAEIGRKAVPALVEVLSGDNPAFRERAMQALSNLKAEAVDALPHFVHALKDERSGVRFYAVHGLGGLGLVAKAAEANIMGRLKDPIPWVRAEAIRALCSLNANSEAFVPALIPLLNDESEEVRTNAILALSSCGVKAKSAIADLMAVLRSDRKLRSESFEQSRAFRAEILSQIPYGRPMPGYETWDIRDYVLGAIAQINNDPRAAFPILLEELRDARVAVRACAVRTFGGIDALAADAVPILVEALRDPEDEVRRSAAMAIGDLYAQAQLAVPALRNAIQDADPGVRFYATDALERIEKTLPGSAK